MERNFGAVTLMAYRLCDAFFFEGEKDEEPRPHLRFTLFLLINASLSKPNECPRSFVCMTKWRLRRRWSTIFLLLVSFSAYDIRSFKSSLSSESELVSSALVDSLIYSWLILSTKNDCLPFSRARIAVVYKRYLIRNFLRSISFVR